MPHPPRRRAKVTVQGCNSPQISPGSQLKQAVRPGGLQRPDKIAPFGKTRDHRSRACSPWWKKWPRSWGHLWVERRVSRSGFRLNRFSRRVFGHDLLVLRAMMTAQTAIMSTSCDLISGCMMPLLHVMRDMRLGLRRLNSLWCWGRGRSLGERHSAEAQSSYGGERECKLVHGYPPQDETAKTLCVIVERNLSFFIHLITNFACMWICIYRDECLFWFMNVCSMSDGGLFCFSLPHERRQFDGHVGAPLRTTLCLRDLCSTGLNSLHAP